MDFYYENQISKLEPKCPPESFTPINRESFRWVFDSMDDGRNFLSQADKNPQIINDKTDIEKCSYYALSFFDSLENCKERFRHFSYMSSKAYKRFGTNIAKGLLEVDDGVAGDFSDATGHFSFHHKRGHDFSSKFVIIDKL